ncbi:MAG: hypothetical protein IJE09_06560 [Oscillospiraceae bacterium]|nr:hypothetical protein [Oscillospiraceae bacterium]
MVKEIRIAIVIVLALAIILSCTVLGNKLTDPATYSHSIEVLDKNRTTVLGLAAASAAASAAVSAIPDDICTPIAEEISELSSWFLIILSVVYLEKYLLTIFGAAACYILIPLGCSLLLVTCFFNKAALRSIGTRLLLFAVILTLAIPTSVWVSDRINDIYSESIETTIESANAASDNLFDEVSNESGENSTVIDEAKTLLGDLSTSIAGVLEQFKALMNRFIEATAVMIVTTCLIPIFVVMFYLWLLKTIFDISIIVPANFIRPKKRRDMRRTEDEYENEDEDELMLVD